MRTSLKVAVVVAVLLAAVSFLSMDFIPPKSLTAGRMWITKRRIMRFAQAHDHLPATLAELPRMPAFDNEIVDAWGRPLLYHFDNAGVVSLSSLGAARNARGDGKDRGLTAVFSSRDARGHWQDELASWDQDPLSRVR